MADCGGDGGEPGTAGRRSKRETSIAWWQEPGQLGFGSDRVNKPTVRRPGFHRWCFLLNLERFSKCLGKMLGIH